MTAFHLQMINHRLRTCEVTLQTESSCRPSSPARRRSKTNPARLRPSEWCRRQMCDADVVCLHATPLKIYSKSRDLTSNSFCNLFRSKRPPGNAGNTFPSSERGLFRCCKGFGCCRRVAMASLQKNARMPDLFRDSVETLG